MTHRYEQLVCIILTAQCYNSFSAGGDETQISKGDQVPKADEMPAGGCRSACFWVFL